MERPKPLQKFLKRGEGVQRRVFGSQLQKSRPASSSSAAVGLIQNSPNNVSPGDIVGDCSASSSARALPSGTAASAAVSRAETSLLEEDVPELQGSANLQQNGVCSLAYQVGFGDSASTWATLKKLAGTRRHQPGFQRPARTRQAAPLHNPAQQIHTWRPTTAYHAHPSIHGHRGVHGELADESSVALAS